MSKTLLTPNVRPRQPLAPVASNARGTDTTAPDYLTFADAAQHAPGHPDAACLWRWARRGTLSRGGERIHLQHVRVGRMLYTTVLWMQEYFAAVAEADISGLEQRRPIAPRPPRPLSHAAQRAAAMEARERLLGKK